MKSNFYGAYTLFKKEVNRFRKVWLQTLLAPLISNLLYLTIFGLSLSRAMPEAGGVSYLQFLVPGLIAMGMMNNAFQNGSSSLIIAKYNETIIDLLKVPISTLGIQYAYAFASVIRGTLVGSVTLIATMFFVDVPFENIPMIIAAVLALNLLFGFLGILVGIWATEFDKVAAVQTFGLTPLIYLGGVFYSISVLPEKFQTLTNLNPFAYLIDILRAGFIGQSYYPLAYSWMFVIVTLLILHTLVYYAIKTGYKIKA